MSYKTRPPKQPRRLPLPSDPDSSFEDRRGLFSNQRAAFTFLKPLKSWNLNSDSDDPPPRPINKRIGGATPISFHNDNYASKGKLALRSLPS